MMKRQWRLIEAQSVVIIPGHTSGISGHSGRMLAQLTAVTWMPYWNRT